MKIGFIGLGIMGKPMCTNLMDKNKADSFFIYSSSEEKQNFFKARGATICQSVGALAEECEIVFSIVPQGNDVANIYDTFFPLMKKEQIFIDMSSIEPSTTQALAAEVKKRGAFMLDCPVVKSKAAAENGTLGIYCGGEQRIYEQVKEYLLCMGSETVYVGENGRGVTMKAIHNMLVGQIQNGVNEMLTLARSKGIAFDDFVRAMRCGGASNAYLDAKAEALKNENFATAFSVKNMHKDVHIAREMAREEGVNFGGLESVVAVYDEAMQLRLGEEDFSATYKVVEKRRKEAR